MDVEVIEYEFFMASGETLIVKIPINATVKRALYGRAHNEWSAAWETYNSETRRREQINRVVNLDNVVMMSWQAAV